MKNWHKSKKSTSLLGFFFYAQVIANICVDHDKNFFTLYNIIFSV